MNWWGHRVEEFQAVQAIQAQVHVLIQPVRNGLGSE